MHWIEKQCPVDVIPKILSFAGPQSMQVLNLTSRHWRSVMEEESTWKVLCEDYHKWKEGDAIPSRWKTHYRLSPCIPLDYSSLNCTSFVSMLQQVQHNSIRSRSSTDEDAHIRVLIKPGKYVLSEGIKVNTAMTVTFQTLDMPDIDYFMNEEEENKEQTAGENISATPKRKLFKRAGKLRKSVMSCRTVNIVNEESNNRLDEIDEKLQPHPSRAMLVLHSRQNNEPIFRVLDGTVNINNMAIIHSSAGIDIWNGNSAVQVQPPSLPDGNLPEFTPRPKVILHKAEVSSRSGRGIVAIDGGTAHVRECYIHDCAATGIYVGGPGSSAIIERADVLRNGNGNRIRRGIGRGHSGIYLEQGTALVRDCNISQNSLSGLSAISQENAILSLEQSDLVANGAIQLEMPPDGSTSRRRSQTRDNRVSTHGMLRERSGLIEVSS